MALEKRGGRGSPYWAFMLAWISLLACKLVTRATEEATPLVTPLPPTDTPHQTQLSPGLEIPLLPSAQVYLPDLSYAPRYTTTLSIDVQASDFYGSCELDYTNNEDVPLQELYFRLLPNGKRSYGNGSLSVSEVKVNGKAASIALSLDDTALRVGLPNAIHPGQSAKLLFKFRGKVPGNSAEEAGYGIYSATQGVLALSGWYPILAVYDDQGWNLDPVSYIGDSVYSDIAFYSVEVNLPANYVVTASGVQVERQASGAQALVRFESGPMRDFFLIASPDFRVVSRKVSETTIYSYYLPGHEAAAQQVLSVASESLQVFNQKFGLFPYSELDVVEAPLNYALGVEFPGIVLIDDNLYNNPEETNLAVTVAHEVAHQWWYNVVGNDVFEEPWLDEGLVTYSSSFYYEFGPAQSPPIGLYEYWQRRYDALVEDGADDLVTQTLGHFESLGNPRVYSTVVYIKAALFFKALREEIGDQAFFSALQNYYQAHRYGIATTADLLEAFEQAAGRSLDDFYEQWLFSKKT